MRPGLGEVRINQYRIIIRGTVTEEGLTEADLAVHLPVIILSCQLSIEQSGRCPLFKFVFLSVEHLFKPAHEVSIVLIFGF